MIISPTKSQNRAIISYGMEITVEKINKILKALTNVREDLCALNDDIWHNLDHSSIEEVQAATSFQIQYIKLLDQFAQNSEEITALVSQFTGIKEEHVPIIMDVNDSENERLIKELNKEEAHSLDEDFTYKHPHGFIVDGCAYSGFETWKDLYIQFCKHLSSQNTEKFDTLARNQSLISKQNRKYFSTNKKDLRYPELITNKTYVELNFSANHFAKRIKEIAGIYKIDTALITIYLQ